MTDTINRKYHLIALGYKGPMKINYQGEPGRLKKAAKRTAGAAKGATGRLAKISLPKWGRRKAKQT